MGRPLYPYPGSLPANSSPRNPNVCKVSVLQSTRNYVRDQCGDLLTSDELQHVNTKLGSLKLPHETYNKSTLLADFKTLINEAKKQSLNAASGGVRQRRRRS